MEKTLTKRSPPSSVKPRAAGFERRTRRRFAETATAASGGEEEEGEEGVAVEEKIAALKKIVPGGAALGMDALFEETAGYIIALQCQIKAMRVLASFLERLETENMMKFGG